MENTKKDSENIYDLEDIDMLRLFYETLFKATKYHPHQMLNLLADTPGISKRDLQVTYKEIRCGRRKSGHQYVLCREDADQGVRRKSGSDHHTGGHCRRFPAGGKTGLWHEQGRRRDPMVRS